MFPSLSRGRMAVVRQPAGCVDDRSRRAGSSVVSTGSHWLTGVWCIASLHRSTTVVGEM